MNLDVILQIINVLPKIQDALRTGGSVIGVITKLAPDLLPILTALGTKFFPQVPAASTAQAAIDVVFDSDGTKWVQNGLNALGQKPPLVVDGAYGPATKAAVSAYQTAHALKVDGWAGPKTSAAMAIELAKLVP